MPTEAEQKDKLLQLMQEVMQQDKTLREQYQIGEKFRFIHDRLAALLKRVEENVVEFEKKIEKKKTVLLEDETLVFVLLYNAQGIVLKTWQKMLSASVFYEYSVNRPIYTEKSLIESYIRSKTNKLQHGFLTIAVKKNDIVTPQPDLPILKDAIGNPLIKVREGSLQFSKLVSFTHNGHEYRLSEAGELVRRE